MNREGSSVSGEDHVKIRMALNRESRIGWIEKRMKAMVFCAWSSAIRLGELLNLDIVDVLESTHKGGRWKVKETFVLTAAKAKRFQGGGTASGKIHFNRMTRQAIRDYISAAIEVGAMKSPLKKNQPLWVSQQKTRISSRTVQRLWVDLQLRAGIDGDCVYRWHDLRHTALTVVGELGDVFDVVALGRFKTIKNTIRYVHPSDERMIELVERGSKRR